MKCSSFALTKATRCKKDKVYVIIYFLFIKTSIGMNKNRGKESTEYDMQFNNIYICNVLQEQLIISVAKETVNTGNKHLVIPVFTPAFTPAFEPAFERVLKPVFTPVFTPVFILVFTGVTPVFTRIYTLTSFV